MEKYPNDEMKLLVRRAIDKKDIAEERYCVTATGFLNEREQDVLIKELARTQGARHVFVGGYPEAERRILAFVPEYLELDEGELIGAVLCTYYKDYELTHRDFLGALMGLGIERETVGDILVDKSSHKAFVIAKREMLPFILTNLTSAGRAALKTEETPLSALATVTPETVTVTDTVASPRIDAVVSSGFGVSRENAAALIKSGKVFLDRVLTAEPDKYVSDGSLISASGYGKFKVYISGGVSKKGRMFIKIQKYV